MKIAQKFQVFDGPDVVITNKDAVRLATHLTSTGRLNELFLLGVNEEDLRRLLVLELMGKRRQDMAARLLGRHLSMYRDKVIGRIEKCANLR